jgi:hypothetical protein
LTIAFCAYDKRMSRSTIFLSHAGSDSDAARRVAHQLRSSGMDVWLDVERLVPGDNWIWAIQQALEASDGFAVYVGSTGVQKWVDRELRYALERNTRDPGYRLIPILGPGAPKADDLPPFLRQQHFIDLRTNGDDASVSGILSLRNSQAVLGTGVLPANVPPFRGLEYFETEHAHLFFGRDPDIDAIVERVIQRRFLAIAGASGVGKSSLIRAGLLPALNHGRIRDSNGQSRRWKVLLCRPADDPFRQLAHALLSITGQMEPTERIRFTAESARRISSADDGLIHCVMGLVEPSDSVLIVVDQFEELFTLTTRSDERRRFIDTLLATASSNGDPRIHVVLTLRADFYSRCWEHPLLPEQIAMNLYAVQRLRGELLREAIEKPLALAGAVFQPGLVERILSDVREEPGDLPLVEHALLQLWDRRDDGTLTHRAYEEIGQVAGALARQADRAFSQLNEVEQAIARKILLKLTQPGSGTEDTRRRAERDELVQIGPAPSISEAVLLSLVDARLVTTRREGDRDYVEVAHEALIREWPQLRAWIESAREDLLVERKLMEAAADWVRLGSDAGALYRGRILNQAEEWAREHGADLRSHEREFLRASVEEQERAVREKDTHKEEMRMFSREVAERYEEITLLYSITEILASPASMDSAAEEILDLAGGILGAEGAAVWVSTGPTELLELFASTMRRDGPGAVIEPVARIASQVFETGRSLILRAREPYLLKETEPIRLDVGLLMAPVTYTPPSGGAELLGVVAVIGPNSSSAGDLKLVSTISLQLGSAIKLMRFTNETKAELDSLQNALSASMLGLAEARSAVRRFAVLAAILALGVIALAVWTGLRQ